MLSVPVSGIRFMPVDASELDDLVYSVDVLTKPEPIDSEDELDPKRYGVIVKAVGAQGSCCPISKELIRLENR